MSGLIFPPVNLYISFPNSTPNAVPIQNAISPSTIILMVSSLRKLVPEAVAPTVVPRKIVMIFISSF